MSDTESSDPIRSSTQAKLATAKQKKDAGDQAFKEGKTQEGGLLQCLSAFSMPKTRRS